MPRFLWKSLKIKSSLDLQSIASSEVVGKGDPREALYEMSEMPISVSSSVDSILYQAGQFPFV
jgi:hypothetical protein